MNKEHIDKIIEALMRPETPFGHSNFDTVDEHYIRHALSGLELEQCDYCYLVVRKSDLLILGCFDNNANAVRYANGLKSVAIQQLKIDKSDSYLIKP